MTNLLLLHGTPLTPAIWSGVIPLLAKRGGVAAPAVVPGHGPAAGVQQALARRLAVPDVVEVPPPWHVIGHSFGGQVALELALQRPDLVESLVLLCTRDTPYPPFAAVAADLSRATVDVGGVGALLVVPFAMLAARIKTSPPAIVMMLAAFWSLVPGALSFETLGAAVVGDVDVRTLGTTAAAIFSIALGTLIGWSVFATINGRFRRQRILSPRAANITAKLGLSAIPTSQSRRCLSEGAPV